MSEPEKKTTVRTVLLAVAVAALAITAVVVTCLLLLGPQDPVSGADVLGIDLG